MSSFFQKNVPFFKNVIPFSKSVPFFSKLFALFQKCPPFSKMFSLFTNAPRFQKCSPIWAPNLGPYLGPGWALGANHPEAPDDLQPGPDESSPLKYKSVKCAGRPVRKRIWAKGLKNLACFRKAWPCSRKTWLCIVADGHFFNREMNNLNSWICLCNWA